VRRTPLSLTITLAFLLIAGCGRDESVRITIEEPQEAGTSGAPAAGNVTNAVAAGTVAETMNAAGYTYIQVDTGDKLVWAAAPKFEINVGDEVVVPEGTPMHDFHSSTLERDFEVVYFVQTVLDANGSSLVGGGSQSHGTQMPAGHPPTTDTSIPPGVDVSGIAKADGGNTVGEIFAGKADLAGKEVTLRGKVVKFRSKIMGKNWLHIQDGSGDSAAGTNDLTVTTDVTVKEGDTVLVVGKLVLDKDFGFGYKYDVIIEDASVTIE
jgi:hypothetical protein